MNSSLEREETQMSDEHCKAGTNSIKKRRAHCRCIICGLKNNEADVKMHRFPKESKISQKWVEACGLEFLEKLTPEVLHVKYRICSNHFQQADYLNSRLLHKDAVPTLNLRNCKVNVENLKESLKASLGSKQGQMMEWTEEGATRPPEETPETPKASQKKRTVTPKTRKIKILSTKLYYLKRKMQKSFDEMKVNSILASVKGLVSPVIYEFIASQLKASQVSRYGRRWNVSDKNLALSLYLASPKAYRSLAQLFYLPTKRTLLKCISGLDLSVGFSEVALNAIKLVARKLKPYDKICIVSLDEMKIKPGLNYNLKTDFIEGFENYGSYIVSDHRPATHALVFMVRGLCKKWKQVFGFFFSCTAASSIALKHLVNEGLSKLFECGLEPVAVVCDQGGCNQRLYFTELGISIEKPYFYVQGHKIYSLFDPPHLLKCIRNNFKRYKVKFVYNDECGTASWDDVRKAYETDSKMDHHAIGKVTWRHIEVDGFDKMNVRLAAQVLSHSLAAVVNYLVYFGVLPSTSSATADFCKLFNDVFDSVNSRVFKHPNRPLLSAVTRSTPHLECWRKFSESIQTIEFQTEGKKIRFPCIEGWLITLSAYQQMIPELLVNVPFILMSRFTQDALENFFSLVRSKGVNNDHPTTLEFKWRMKLLMAQQVFSTCGNANCEPDEDTVLVPVDVLTKSAAKGRNQLSSKTSFLGKETIPSISDIVYPTSPENMSRAANEGAQSSQNSSFMSEVAVSDTVHQDLPEDVFRSEVEILLCRNSAAYVAGYLGKIVNKKFNCILCKSLLLSEKVFTENTIFLYFKEFDSVKEGLHVPSDSWLETIHEFGQRFSFLFDHFKCFRNVKCNIVINLLEVEHGWFSCTNHGAWEFIVDFYVKIMIFHRVKYLSEKFRNSKKNKKKVTKLS